MTAGFDRRSLHARRHARGMSQQELADLLGVTRQAVSEWERGKVTPLHTTLPALANALDCRIDDLFILVTTADA